MKNEGKKVVIPKTGADIAIGTTFLGTVSGFTGLFLRTYDDIVWLNNPNACWGNGGRWCTVRDFREVDIEIEIL